MKPLSLRRFRVCGDWAPLMSRMPGWRSVGPFGWTNGASLLEQDCEAMGGGFDASFVRCGGAPVEPKRVLEAPSGLVLRVSAETASTWEPTEYDLNHAAWYTDKLELDSAWMTKVLGARPLLRRTSAWEPVRREFIEDSHFFVPGQFYVTLRQSSSCYLDHIGWMAAKPDRVDWIADFIGRLGWELVWGPESIDGSYLVHFRGPDGRVHDVYCPSEVIRERSKATDGDNS